MITGTTFRNNYSWAHDSENNRFMRTKNSVTTFYEIERVIGSGYFSRVFVIAPENGGKKKAVKYFKKEVPDPNIKVKDAFFTEIRALCQIPPNSTGVELPPKAYFEQGDFMIIKPLYESIIGDPDLVKTGDEVLNIMDQLLQGMDLLLQKQIYDLDINEFNILYRKKNDKNRCDITDFGFRQDLLGTALSNLAYIFKRMVCSNAYKKATEEDMRLKGLPLALTEFINQLYDGKITTNLHAQFIACKL